MSTPLASSFSPFSWWLGDPRPTSPYPFNITQDTLNALLINITVSSIPILAFWTTNVEVDQNLTLTEYFFSRPLNIGVPYGFLLGLALPFLILGMWALYANGVAAQDGGFFQIPMTTRGSSLLNQAAKGGCLGGEENMPDALRDLKIRFGRVISEHDDTSGISLAGFGAEGQVTAIEKGRPYGVS